MLNLAHILLGWKDGHDVKTKGSCELEGGKHQHFLQEVPILVEPLALVIRESPEALEEFKLVDLFMHAPITSDGVVIHEGNDLQPHFLAAAQDVEK